MHLRVRVVNIFLASCLFFYLIEHRFKLLNLNQYVQQQLSKDYLTKKIPQTQVQLEPLFEKVLTNMHSSVEKSIDIQSSFRPDTGKDSLVWRKSVRSITLDQQRTSWTSPSWLGSSPARKTWECKKAPASLLRRPWCTFPSTLCSIAGSTRFSDRNMEKLLQKARENFLKKMF